MESIIEVRDLTKAFKSRKAKIIAVDHISFDVNKGEIFGMIGPNGAGKSTTFAMMTKLIKPRRGSIKVAHKLKVLPCSKVRVKALLLGDYTDHPENLPFVHIKTDMIHCRYFSPS